MDNHCQGPYDKTWCKKCTDSLVVHQQERIAELETERNMGIVDAAEKADEYEDLVRRFNALETKCERLELERNEQERYRIINRKQVDKLERENYLLGGENGRLKNCLVSQGEAWEAQLALMRPVVEAAVEERDSRKALDGVEEPGTIAMLDELVMMYEGNLDASVGTYLAARQAAGTSNEAQNEWHPASELPDDHRRRKELDDREVLIAILDKGKWAVYLGYWAGKWFFADDDKEAAGISLWREVPQPPKEADDVDAS